MLQTSIPKLTFVFLLYNSLCHGQLNQHTTFTSKEDNQLNIKLRGRVKNISIKSQDLENETIDSLFYAFDKNGTITDIKTIGQGVNVIERKIRLEEIHYKFEQGRPISKLNKAVNGLDGYVYQYDKDWNLTLEKMYMMNKLIDEISFKYDEQKRIVEKTKHLYGGFSDYNEHTEKNKSDYLYTIEHYAYDEAGNLISKTEKYLKKKFTDTRLYKYDTANNLIEEGYCMSDLNKKDCIYTPLFGYEYNSKNQLVKKFQLAKFSPHNTDAYHQYDENGNEVESKGFYIYPDKGTILGYHFKYEYDQFGNKIKDVEVVGGNRSLGFDQYQTETTKYDKYQNVVRIEYLRQDGSPIKVISKKYSYDNSGNWTTMEISEGNSHDRLKSTEIITRTIEYYQ
ncbi:MAG: hypothetical protein JNK18_14255 [Cyclobacteriaceae bacterium]|nr:hypothetical protein [Cyclobacteriaceae bacterium]